MLGRAVRNEQIGEAMEHIVGSELAPNDDGHAAARELVDHRQHANPPPILGAILHEVVRPHVIGSLRPQPDARAVVEPDTPTLGLLLRDFQPFPPPDAVDTLDAHAPALIDEQLADAPVAVATILRRKPHDRFRQRRFVCAHFRLAALRRA